MSEVIGVEELFGSKVFTRATMRERLPKNVYKEVIRIMEEGGELTLAAADVVAKAMKDWGGRLQKSNGGVQRLAQRGRKSRNEYKRISRPNCETNKSNSNESWS